MITKETTDLQTADFASGEVILFDKPFLWSSYKVVHIVKKAVAAKVGHAGTLDPRATGLLILCTGKKTKEISLFQNLKKTYTGTITLGKRSPSLDLETEIIEEKPFSHLTNDNIETARKKFEGEIKQIPPMFSAVKHKGKNLYLLARKGKEIEREPRTVNIEKFLITKIELPDIHFEIVCSKGTYIRTIADDFGKELGTGGVLTELRRTKIGDLSVEVAWDADEFVKSYKSQIND